jgi:DNA-binding HxlR family transcriptional regulator
VRVGQHGAIADDHATAAAPSAVDANHRGARFFGHARQRAAHLIKECHVSDSFAVVRECHLQVASYIMADGRASGLAPCNHVPVSAMNEEQTERARSGLDVALDRVGDRWSLLIVEALLDGAARFNDLAAIVHGIAPNILTDRLRKLEKAGVVVAQRYSERPVRLSYALSEDGQELAGVLRLLGTWGATGAGRGTAEGAEGLRHVACGSLLEARWYCPTCAQAVADDEASNLRYA